MMMMMIKRSLPWDHRAPYILIEPSYNETSRNDLALFHTAKGCWMKAALQEGIRDLLERKASMAAQSLDGTALCSSGPMAAAVVCSCCYCRRIAPGWRWCWHAVLISSVIGSHPAVPPHRDSHGRTLLAAVLEPAQLRLFASRLIVRELRLFHQDLGK